MLDVPPIRFADARGARIAYQAFGDGPPIVAIPPLAQNIEVAWEAEPIAAMLRRIGRFSRYVHFDKRGTGASDRRSRVNDIDQRVDDLRAVMDAAGIDRAHLFANSEGGPMALLFAATYPDRVASIVAWGTGAALFADDLHGDAERMAGVEAFQDAFAAMWGTDDSWVVDRFAPSLAGDPTFRAWHQRYERTAADAGSLRELLRLMAHMDAGPVLPSIEAPVLVLHRTEDQVVPVALGRRLADAIDGAKLVELDGRDHFSYAGDQGWIDIVERWVTGAVAPRPPIGRPTKVRIETLGRFAVVVDGAEVPTSAWGSRLARRLCQRLVAARGWPVTREELFDLFWPDEPDITRLGPRLSVYLSSVRRVLRGGVDADRESVRLVLDEVSIDLEDLHKAQTDADVVASYAGPFLPDAVYEAWTGPVRDEARTRFAAAARRLATTAAAARRHDEAARLARRLIASDPYDEDAHRRLIAALSAMGEKREAARAHDAYAAAMGELGVPVLPLASLV